MNWTSEQLAQFGSDYKELFLDIVFNKDGLYAMNYVGVVSSILFITALFVGDFSGPSYMYQKAIAIVNVILFIHPIISSSLYIGETQYGVYG